MRVKCDASRSGLGAAREQLAVDGWKPIAITSRFFKIVQFKNYLYGKQFIVITNHRALLSILKKN